MILLVNGSGTRLLQRERERGNFRERKRDAAEELEAIGCAEEGANLRHLFDCSSCSSKVPKFSDPFKLPTVIPPSLSFQILLGLIQKKKKERALMEGFSAEDLSTIEESLQCLFYICSFPRIGSLSTSSAVLRSGLFLTLC